MNSILKYLNFSFYSSGNVVRQMVKLNVFFFVLLLVCKVFFSLFSYSYYYDVVCNYLYLSTPWQAVLYKPWSLFTCFLVHKGVFNLLFVVLSLNAIGDAVVYLLGNRVFMWLYVMGGVFGSLFFLFASSYIPAIKHQSLVLYGSTAGIYSLLAGLGAFAPGFSFRVFLIADVKLKYILIFLVVFKLFDLGNGQLAALASIGGMLFGYFYMFLFKNGIDLSRVVGLFKRGVYRNFKVKRFGKKAKFFGNDGNNAYDGVEGEGYEKRRLTLY